MFFKYLFLALSWCSIAMAKDKAADLVKKEKRDARHYLYEQCETKSICSLDSEKKSYYRTIVQEHLDGLHARQARLGQSKNHKIANGLSLLGGALGSLCVTAAIMYKIHTGAYDKKAVVEVVKAATEIAQEATKTEKVEEVDLLPGAAFGAFFTATSAFVFASAGIDQLKKAMRLKEDLQEKIARDERVLSWLLMH